PPAGPRPRAAARGRGVRALGARGAGKRWARDQALRPLTRRRDVRGEIVPRARRNPFLGSGETRGEGDGGDIQRFGRRSRVEVVERRLSDARPVAVARAIRRLLRLGTEERRAEGRP